MFLRTITTQLPSGRYRCDQWLLLKKCKRCLCLRVACLCQEGSESKRTPLCRVCHPDRPPQPWENTEGDTATAGGDWKSAKANMGPSGSLMQQGHAMRLITPRMGMSPPLPHLQVTYGRPPGRPFSFSSSSRKLTHLCVCDHETTELFGELVITSVTTY